MFIKTIFCATQIIPPPEPSLELTAHTDTQYTTWLIRTENGIKENWARCFKLI